MQIKNWIYLLLFCWMASLAYGQIYVEGAGTPKEQVQKIDTELKMLGDMKTRYENSAEKWERKAHDWQFNQNQTLEARKAYQQADMEREMAKEIQVRIDYLNSEKKRILQEHPEANG